MAAFIMGLCGELAEIFVDLGLDFLLNKILIRFRHKKHL